MNQQNKLRLDRIDRFYYYLDQFEQNNGGLYSFTDDYINDLPKEGIEFYFEKGEYRTGSNKLRVVRIGSSNGIVRRLKNHIGEDAQKSVFRRHIGRALLKKQGGLKNLNPKTIPNFNIDCCIDEKNGNYIE